MEFKKTLLFVGIFLFILLLPVILVINPMMDFYQSLIDENPDGSLAPWTQLKMADIYLYTGRPDRAATAYYKFFVNYEDDLRGTEAFFYYAVSLDDDGKNKDAYYAYKQFLEDFPDDPLAGDAKKRADKLKYYR